MGCIAMIDLDFDAITSLEQLEAVPNALSLQISTGLDALSGGLNSFTKMGSSGCSVFGTVVSFATNVAQDALRAASGEIQAAVGKATEEIGILVSDIKTVTANIEASLNNAIARLKAKITIDVPPALLDELKAILNTIKTAYNAAEAVMSELMSNVTGLVNGIFSSFADSLIDLKGRFCSIMNGAINNVPSGISSAMDQVKSVAAAPVDVAKEIAMSPVQTQMQSATSTLDSALEAMGGVSADPISAAISELDKFLD